MRSPLSSALLALEASDLALASPQGEYPICAKIIEPLTAAVSSQRSPGRSDTDNPVRSTGRSLSVSREDCVSYDLVIGCQDASKRFRGLLRNLHVRKRSIGQLL